jgi:hypothetical protein
MNWTDNPEYLRKGIEFEGFTRRMFPDAYFEILFQSDEKGTKVPDFYIRRRTNQYKFWVEAKYRDRPVGDKIDIYEDKPDRLVILRVFQELVLPETVFLVLGLGGDSSSPADLFCLPVKELAFPSPFSKNLEKWRIDSSPFSSYENGSLVK